MTITTMASISIHLRILPDELRFGPELGLDCYMNKCTSQKFKSQRFVVRALSSGDGRNLVNNDDAVVVAVAEKVSAVESRLNPVAKLRESISSLPLFVSSTGKFKFGGTNLAIGLCIVATILVVSLRSYAARKSRYRQQGSVADLVRRGQLRSDRRGISAPLKYEDPFNNPMVKVSKSNSTVEMCGKVYRLAPVTLTNEQQNIHQRRRSRAYQWKRPTMFLKEGESVPPDVDPDTIRWIPANHPFATTASDIDEDLAQNNVYQKHGVPFRIQAEHEALQKKLEALQNDQKLNKLVIDPAAARDFERPLKSYSKLENQAEQSISNSKVSPNPPTSDRSFGNKPPSEGTKDT